MNLEAAKLRARAQVLRVYVASLRAAMGDIPPEESPLLQLVIDTACKAAEALDLLADVADDVGDAFKGRDLEPVG
jgi:hypothetical protein